MSLRFTLFITVSVLVHAGALLWPTNTTPILRIGGETQALRVSIAAMPAAISVPETPPASEPVAERKPVDANHTPVIRQLTQSSPQIVPLQHMASALNHSEPQAIDTQPHPAFSSEQSAPDVGRKVSIALRNRLSSHFVYPWLARQRGWEGQVLLSLTVMGNGDLGDWKVAQTSGYRTLDSSALQAAQRIEHLPQAAAWLNGKSLEVQVPVQYHLLDS